MGLEPTTDALSCSPPPGPAALMALREPSDSQVFGLERLPTSKSLLLSHWTPVGAQEAGLIFISWNFSEWPDGGGVEILATVC